MKINDLVTYEARYKNIIFRIINIEKEIATIRGEVIRLICDVPISELTPIVATEKEISLPTIRSIGLLRSEVIKGRVLHIDGDEYYLKKAIEAYKQYGIPAIGYYIKENEMPSKLMGLLKKHQPDILVITGHDAYEGDSLNIGDINNYRNSKYFAECITIAREYQPNKDNLVIIAGACQSYYEFLIKQGANFASSPERTNIHLLDPVIVASQISTTYVNEFAVVDRVLENTISHGIGGIDTRGSMRRIYKGRIT